MKRTTQFSYRQVPLPLQREDRPPLSELVREQVVGALAELLLEALGRESNPSISELGADDEHQDHE